MIKRVPCWVTPEELEQLNVKVLEETEKNGASRRLNAIKAELSVAKIRFDNARYEKGMLASALGLKSDMIPIRLSSREKKIIMEFSISAELKERLS
jgi:hypothetical protein